LNPNIKNKLDNFLKDEINLTASDINKATNDLHSVIQQVADLTLRKKSKNKRKKTQNEKWFDQDLHKKKKQVKDKGFLMSKYPHDPLIRGSFFKINKEYAKLKSYQVYF
jgi:hypothetical protein